MSREELDASLVHRGLDRKIKVLGFELLDLLAVFLFASVMNLFFGQTFLSVYLVFLLPGLALIVLYFGKRGKPAGFLQHGIRYLLTPGFYSAGEKPLSKTARQKGIVKPDREMKESL